MRIYSIQNDTSYLSSVSCAIASWTSARNSRTVATSRGHARRKRWIANCPPLRCGILDGRARLPIWVQEDDDDLDLGQQDEAVRMVRGLCEETHDDVSGLTRLSGMDVQGPDTDGVETNLSTRMIVNVMKIHAIKPSGAHSVIHPVR